MNGQLQKVPLQCYRANFEVGGAGRKAFVMPLPDRGWRAMAMLSLKVATEIWSPEHSSARMHRLLGPAVFVRRSLVPAVLISLSMVCGRNALACVRQSAQNPFGWLVGRVTASRVGHYARRRVSNSFEQRTQCVTRELAKGR